MCNTAFLFMFTDSVLLQVCGMKGAKTSINEHKHTITRKVLSVNKIQVLHLVTPVHDGQRMCMQSHGEQSYPVNAMY
jgi:hypothetical protein